ncbi:MAG: hypothetical protein ABR529_06315 [Actinomycetota bacterium]
MAEAPQMKKDSEVPAPEEAPGVAEQAFEQALRRVEEMRRALDQGSPSPAEAGGGGRSAGRVLFRAGASLALLVALGLAAKTATGGAGPDGGPQRASASAHASERAAGATPAAPTVTHSRAPGDKGKVETAAAMSRHVNEAGGYSFLYPRGWKLERAGEVSRVRSPGGHLIVSFGLGPVGLPASYDGFASLLVDSYQEVRLAEVTPTYVGRHRSLSVRGSAVDGTGRPLSFRAMLVERGDQRSIGAFAASDSGNLDARVHAVLRSLRGGV